MTIDILIEDEAWRGDDLVDAVRGAIEAALAHRGMKGKETTVSVLLADDARIAKLNADHRGKAQPTNVLSWPAQDLARAPGADPDPPEADPDDTTELGDIALAFQTCRTEAGAQAKPMADHVAHLAVHGFLHLLGYDHETEEDAELMERIETRILETLGIPDPYRNS